MKKQKTKNNYVIVLLIPYLPHGSITGLSLLSSVSQRLTSTDDITRLPVPWLPAWICQWEMGGQEESELVVTHLSSSSLPRNNPDR